MNRLRGLGAIVACLLACALAGGAVAEQASAPGSAAAGRLDVGDSDSCAVLSVGTLRCWGFNGDGQLGYGNTAAIGDDETPASVGPVAFGAGQTATAIAAGSFHTCALLEGGSVRCWGFGANGRLGYGNESTVKDPSLVGPVDLGPGHVARAISAGTSHTCAVRDDGGVLCWGFGGNDRDVSEGTLGYLGTRDVGDNETPGSVGPVKLGGRAVAVTAGGRHTCALLEDGGVRCWGYGYRGALGYGNIANAGDRPGQTPDVVGPVRLANAAVAISAGNEHTCALLDDGTVSCWGVGADGRLGYGNTNDLGNSPETIPELAGTVELGGLAVAISAGGSHTCALLTGGSVRCWGLGSKGRLGYANQLSIGDDETPDEAGPVSLGHPAVAISAGSAHNCARLDDGSVRCWGDGSNGRLGYGDQASIGDNEPPSAVGPVELGDRGVGTPPPLPPSEPSSQGETDPTAADLGAQAARASGLRSCRRGITGRLRREVKRADRLSRPRRSQARRRLKRRKSELRRRCVKRWGRTPGNIKQLEAQASARGKVTLSFGAAGTEGTRGPAARGYVVKQSRRPIRGARGFRRAQTLCKSACRFPVSTVGQRVSLSVTDLRPHTAYYYSVAARDNVSGRRGPRSNVVRVRTR